MNVTKIIFVFPISEKKQTTEEAREVHQKFSFFLATKFLFCSMLRPEFSEILVCQIENA